MSSSVGESGSVQAGSAAAPGASGNVSADSGSAVSSGYSAANSVSQAAGSSSDGSQAGVSLDAPADNSGAGGVDFLAQALQTKLDSFRATIAQNNALTPEGLDLSDTRNLLLSLRGMINDLMVLNSVTTIELRSLDRQTRISLPSDINGLKKSVADTQGLINSKRSQLEGASDYQKQTLQNEIASLEATNLSRQVRLSAKETLLGFHGTEDNAVSALSVPLVKAISPESLESGEERLDDLKQELQVIDKRFASDEVRSRLAGLIVAEYNKKTVRESDGYFESGHQQDFSEELTSLISPEFVDNLFSLFSATDASTLASIRNQTAPSEQQLTDAAESLALVMLAESQIIASEENPVDQPNFLPEPREAVSKENPVDPADFLPEPQGKVSEKDPVDSPGFIAKPGETAGEENPVDQPYLGDSLSFEGANNPQAFALLLLKDRMSDMQEALGTNADGVLIDSVGDSQIAQLLETERAVNVMVMEADRDRERYEAAIPKSHPV
ncbi:hypothetical protein [Endozoicomonas sp. SCSIO W0465]|uniref:hypothetical protein n=1 Tax=Endozoicomonas sp. SCSIO W0465 TaxID=2918516 RepID=UPI002075BB19|nr:hypothetical protein [Endozoicomonas sp. SCSIO W0465]USE34497.1 hypothetical protein MJO57_20435 [Endozoicomonas sp. SCSIO W0465]